MEIYPALDLMEGSCVRLLQGQFNLKHCYSQDPLRVAQDFASQGARTLHIVDLDGARTGDLQQLELIEKIVTVTGLHVQVGGGIRHRRQLEQVFSSGVTRAVIGSMGIMQPEEVLLWLEDFGTDKLVLGLDVRLEGTTPFVATHGWQQNTSMTLWDLLSFFHKKCEHVLCTDIQKDGVMQGPNVNLYDQCLKRFPHIKLQASGGIATLSDLEQLKNLDVTAAIVGKAFYEQKFSYADVKGIS